MDPSSDVLSFVTVLISPVTIASISLLGEPSRYYQTCNTKLFRSPPLSSFSVLSFDPHWNTGFVVWHPHPAEDQLRVRRKILSFAAYAPKTSPGLITITHVQFLNLSPLADHRTRNMDQCSTQWFPWRSRPSPRYFIQSSSDRTAREIFHSTSHDRLIAQIC